MRTLSLFSFVAFALTVAGLKYAHNPVEKAVAPAKAEVAHEKTVAKPRLPLVFADVAVPRDCILIPKECWDLVLAKLETRPEKWVKEWVKVLQKQVRSEKGILTVYLPCWNAMMKELQAVPEAEPAEIAFPEFAVSCIDDSLSGKIVAGLQDRSVKWKIVFESDYDGPWGYRAIYDMTSGNVRLVFNGGKDAAIANLAVFVAGENVNELLADDELDVIYEAAVQQWRRQIHEDAKSKAKRVLDKIKFETTKQACPCGDQCECENCPNDCCAVSCCAVAIDPPDRDLVTRLRGRVAGPNEEAVDVDVTLTSKASDSKTRVVCRLLKVTIGDEVVAATSAFIYVPEPPPASAKKKNPLPAYPEISMDSNWGKVSQDGDKVFIDGHSYWSAHGRFRMDGKVELIWLVNETLREAPGLYEVKDGRLVGVWGWDGAVEFNVLGDLQGDIHGDEICKQAKEPPQGQEQP